MKTCPKCKETKELTEFWGDKATKDGKRGHCIACDNAYNQTSAGIKRHREGSRRWRQTPKGRAYNRDVCRAYARSDRGKAVRRAREKRYLETAPEKRRARAAAYSAITAGKLPHPTTLPCVDCGGVMARSYHHDSYDRDKRLDVTALCQSCHVRRHYGSEPADLPLAKA